MWRLLHTDIKEVQQPGHSSLIKSGTYISPHTGTAIDPTHALVEIYNTVGLELPYSLANHMVDVCM